MSGWDGAYGVVGTWCADCGADVPAWTGPIGFSDPRDDGEEGAARRALALQAHRYTAHRVTPAVGDLVRYSMPWRGLIIESEVMVVVSIREGVDFHDYARRISGVDLPPLIGTSYTLASARRPNDSAQMCFPFFGDPENPYTFALVEAAPPFEGDLMDLLGWDAAVAS